MFYLIIRETEITRVRECSVKVICLVSILSDVYCVISSHTGREGKERILFEVKMKSKLCLSSCREENVALFCLKKEKHDLYDMCAVDY